MSKTYADECLERVRKATPKPWFDSRTTKSIKVSKDSPAFDRGDFVICRYPTRTNNSLLSHEEWEGNSEFIAHARTDVEELAIRLNMSIAMNKSLRDSIVNKLGCDDEALEEFNNVIKTIEAIPK